MLSLGGGGGRASPLMRGTSSRAQAHFLFLKVNRQPAGVWGVMGKEETVMLIRLLHTSPSNNKTKQEWKHGKATDNWGGTGYTTAMDLDLNCTMWLSFWSKLCWPIDRVKRQCVLHGHSLWSIFRNPNDLSFHIKLLGNGCIVYWNWAFRVTLEFPSQNSKCLFVRLINIKGWFLLNTSFFVDRFIGVFS